MVKERKEKLLRVLQILQTTDERTPINTKKIIEILENQYLIGKTDRRTIYRDVEMLQFCGYPVKRARDKRRGWYMEQHLLEDWEIKVMLDAIHQAKCVSYHEAGRIREKLLDLTSARGRSRLMHMITPRSQNANVDEEIGAYIETMIEAMHSHKKIQFQYTEVNDNMEKVLRRDGHLYTLSLYALYWSSDNY